jgi:hypothetical protein
VTKIRRPVASTRSSAPTPSAGNTLGRTATRKVSWDDARRMSAAASATSRMGIRRTAAASRGTGGGLDMPHCRSDAEATSTSAPTK